MTKTSLFILLLTIGFLASCGQKSKTSESFGLSGQNSFDDQGEVPTSDTTSDTQTYMPLSSADEVSKMKGVVNLTDANKNFASSFGAVTITNDAPNVIDVLVSSSISQKPLEFKGTLSANSTGYTGRFSEASGQNPNLTLAIFCKNENCSHADLILRDKQGDKAAIIVNREEGILHQSLGKDQTFDQMKKAGLEPFDQDTLVEYDSTEIFPGVTTVTVRTKDAQHKTLLQAQVHASDDNSDSVPATIASSANTSNLTAQLDGAASDQAVFEVSNSSQQHSYYTVETTQAAQPQTVGTCPVKVQGPVHPLVQKLLNEDCTDPRMITDIVKWTKVRPKDSKDYPDLYTLNVYLKLFAASQTATRPSEAKDFQTMLEVLHNNKLPSVWSFITMRESSFNWKAAPHGPLGAVGIWQLEQPTASDYGVQPEEREEVVPATQAAAAYSNELLGKWDNNIKMALASYNQGFQGVKNDLVKVQRPYTTDFWEMCHLAWQPDIKDGPCKYVPEIVSGMITSLDPSAFGVANVGAMEAR